MLRALLLLLALCAGCERRETEPAISTPPPVRVRVAIARAETLPHLTEIAGTVRPNRHAVVASNVPGTVAQHSLVLGRRVGAGDVLVRISVPDLVERAKQAQSDLDVLRRDLDRERELEAKGASTAETVRTLQLRLTGAEAALREAEARLAFSEVAAPFAGVIARRLVDVGDFAAAGQPLFELEGIGGFEIEAPVPESLVSQLQAGTKLRCETSGMNFQGIVREISSTADIATRSVLVKVAVPAEVNVRSGEFTRVQIPGATVPALLVPAAAVSVTGQLQRVFVVNDSGGVTLRLVRTGAARSESIELLSGVQPGERVVVSPPAALRDGQAIEVEP